MPLGHHKAPAVSSHRGWEGCGEEKDLEWVRFKGSSLAGYGKQGHARVATGLLDAPTGAASSDQPGGSSSISLRGRGKQQRNVGGRMRGGEGLSLPRSVRSSIYCIQAPGSDHTRHNWSRAKKQQQGQEKIPIERP